MLKDRFDALVRVMGPEKQDLVLTRVLQQEALEAHEEQYLAEKRAVLSAGGLLRWLSKPTCDERVRPTDSILAALVERRDEWVPYVGAYGVFDGIPPLVVDDLVERTWARVEPQVRRTLLDFAYGEVVFKTLLRGDRERSRNFTPELRWGDLDFSVTEPLFKHRRDDAALCRGIAELAAEGTDEVRAQTLRVLDRAGLVNLFEAPAELLPRTSSFDWELGFGGTLSDQEWEVIKRHRWIRALALRWPGPGAMRAKNWFVGQVLRAAAGGDSWGRLWWEIPSCMRDEVALLSLETPCPAPWAIRALLVPPVSAESWLHAVRLYETANDEQVTSRPFAYGHATATVEEEREAERALNRGGLIAALISGPFSPAVPSDFWVRLLTFAQAHRPSFSFGPEWDVYEACRPLPLTRLRANQLVALALADRRLLARDDFDAVADMADPPDADKLPELGELLERRSRIPAWYRKLGGEDAKRRIHSLMMIDENAESRLTYRAVRCGNEHPDLRDEAATAAIRRSALRLPFLELAVLQAKEAPWIMGREAIRKLGIERARTEDTWDVGIWGTDLPPDHRDAMLARLDHEKDEGELVDLLDWLKASGCPRRELVQATLRVIRARSAGSDLAQLDSAQPPTLAPEHGERLIAWVGRLFRSRSAWEKDGRPLVSALLDRSIRWYLRRLVIEQPWKAVSTPPDNKDRGAHEGGELASAIHECFALELLARADGALRATDVSAAAAYLSAVACLDAPSRVCPCVRRLREAPNVEAVLELIEDNERLFKHAPPRAVNLRGVLDALETLKECGQ